MLLAILLLAGVLAGCGKGPQVKEYGSKPPIEALSWGMSIDEALSALKLSEDDVTLSHRVDVSNMALEGERELSGVSGKVSLQFADARDDMEIGLYAVTLSSEEQDLDALKNVLDEKLGSEGTKNGESYVWSTGTDKVSALEDEALKSRLQELTGADDAIEDKEGFTSVILSKTSKNNKDKIEAVFFGKNAAYSAAVQKQAK